MLWKPVSYVAFMMCNQHPMLRVFSRTLILTEMAPWASRRSVRRSKHSGPWTLLMLGFEVRDLYNPFSSKFWVSNPSVYLFWAIYRGSEFFVTLVCCRIFTYWWAINKIHRLQNCVQSFTLVNHERSINLLEFCQCHPWSNLILSLKGWSLILRAGSYWWCWGIALNLCSFVQLLWLKPWRGNFSIRGRRCDESCMWQRDFQNSVGAGSPC